VARTDDGGITWTLHPVSGADSLDLRSIVALDARTAVAAAAGPAEQGQARMFRTEDAGATWREVFSTGTHGVFLDGLAFWDGAHGVAVSDPVDGKLYVLLTDDGGRTWTRVPPDALPAALPGEAMFAASGTCVTVWGQADVWIGTGGGATARVYHSGDRGRTWTVADTPVAAGSSASGIFALAFRDARHGVAVGGDYTKPHGSAANAAVSDDGGRTWRAATGPRVNAYLSGVSWVDSTTVVAVGLAGTAVSRDAGESWTLVDSLPLNAVRFRGNTIGVAAGPRGRLARWLHDAPPR
jgi:photosystem II stability/assembly factor-like uncharacterized protein